MLRPFSILSLMLLGALQPHSAPTGKEIASSIKVEFKLPAAWTSQQIVMDPIWQPLGLSGVNFYAFGAAIDGHTFASRSDPGSQLYQAWIGTYVVAGGQSRFFTSNPDANFSQVIQLAEFDQKAWLRGMGDSAPKRNPNRLTLSGIFKLMVRIAPFTRLIWRAIATSAKEPVKSQKSLACLRRVIGVRKSARSIP